MHELSITQSIVNIAAETAAKHQVKRVNEIRIRIGEYSGIVPQCVQQYFDILSKGTAAEGAVLKMEPNPDYHALRGVRGGECDRQAEHSLSRLRKHSAEAADRT